MNQDDPVDILSCLADKAKEQREAQRHQNLFIEQWQGIAFLCGDTTLMASLSMLIEICPCPKLMPIPGVKNWFRGVTNLRGDILPITDLQYLLFQTKTEIKKNTPVFVIQYQGELIGILVNKIIALHRVPVGEPRPLTAELSNELSHYVSEEFQIGEQIFPLFDFHKLIADPIFSKI